MTTPQNLDERFRDIVADLSPPPDPRPPQEPVRPGTPLTGARALHLFDAQVAGRHLDLAARWLRSFNEGFHAVSSAGHEGNAAVAAALRTDDPALLHHRSAAFFCARAAQAGRGEDDPLIAGVRDVLRAVVASAADAGAGVRHTAFGRPDLHAIPTTSTPGGHLPRAVGVAFGLQRAAALDGVAAPWPADAIAVCSFGNGAANHASATVALNTAGWHAHTGTPLPVLLICEDNEAGSGAPSPAGWLATLLGSRPGVRYQAADGCDLVATYDAAAEAAAWVREHRRPAVLHLSMVRLMGHAGAEPRPAEDLAADLARDPLVGTARLLVEAGVARGKDLITRYDEIGWQVRKAAEDVLGEPKLATAADVAAPLAPRRPLRVARAVADTGRRAAELGAVARAAAFGGTPPEHGGPLTLAQTINAALTDTLLSHPGMLLFGPGLAAKGGTYGVTRGLQPRFGAERVFDTLLDETSVLGLALGAGLAGLLPVPELPHLGCLHDAGSQLRGEAATLSFLSAATLRNPMVVRVAGLADPQSFGEPGRNDHSVAALRDVPGLVLAVPARAADAAPMLRTCLAAATTDGTVCVFLEPSALYHVRDLYRQGDNGWLAPYAGPGEWAAAHMPIGRAATYPVGSGEDLTILTYGNGVRMSLRVAARLAAAGYGARVVDLRWLCPLPAADLVREAAATGRALIVDETRRSGGVGEGIIAALADGGFVGAVRRIAAADAFIPRGPAARHVLIGEDAITEGAHALLAR